jgi:hypothetical protein
MRFSGGRIGGGGDNRDPQPGYELVDARRTSVQKTRFNYDHHKMSFPGHLDQHGDLKPINP